LPKRKRATELTEEKMVCREWFQQENRRRWKKARGLTGDLPETEKWTEEETDVVYSRSIEWSAEIVGRGKGDGVEESRRKIWSEYREFLGNNAYGVT
jgi:hypothetical protein